MEYWIMLYLITGAVVATVFVLYECCHELLNYAVKVGK